MALMNLKFFSESLGMQTEVYVVIPQKSSVGEIGINSKKDADKYKCLYIILLKTLKFTDLIKFLNYSSVLINWDSRLILRKLKTCILTKYMQSSQPF